MKWVGYDLCGEGRRRGEQVDASLSGEVSKVFPARLWRTRRMGRYRLSLWEWRKRGMLLGEESRGV